MRQNLKVIAFCLYTIVICTPWATAFAAINLICNPFYSSQADFDDNCLVNFSDFAIMAENWLGSDYSYPIVDAELHNFAPDNSQWVSGKINNALVFDGVNDWVDIYDGILNDFYDKTITMWAKRDGINNLAYLFGTSWSYRIYICIDPDGNVFAKVKDEEVGTRTQMAEGIWHHLALVIRNGFENRCIGEFYIDGVSVGLTNAQDRHIGPLTGANIGSYNDGMNAFVFATVDDFRVYDYALSAWQIQNIASHVQEVFNPMVWYKLDEVSGLIAKDSGVKHRDTADINTLSVLAADWLNELLIEVGGQAYFVDSVGGNDYNSGTSHEQAWKSLARVNDKVFAPGDMILFKAGTVYAGRLKPQGSGREYSPIIIDIYGKGDKPLIYTNGEYPEALLLYNAEYWEINNLEITNLGPTRFAARAGVRAKVENFGTAHHIHLKNLFIHKVNGSYNKGAGGGTGITCELNDSGELISSFNDLLIENCIIKDVERDGIATRHLTEDYWHRDKNCPFSTKVIVRHNLLENLGGDGIVVRACDGALLEHNIILHSENPLGEAYGGIWPFSSDNTIIQFNEVGHLRGTHDGYAYDSDRNCLNTFIQYNYSHDNEGGFVLITSYEKLDEQPFWSAGNHGTVIRYNISVNDGYDTWGPIFAFSDDCNNIQIYNNTVYVSGFDINLVDQWAPYGQSAKSVQFFNNIFYVAGRVNYDFITMDHFFDSNVFYGDHQDRPYDANAITVEPMLVNPGDEPDGLHLDGYKLRTGSPCAGAGVTIPNNGSFDFWQNTVPAISKPDIGAHQFSN